MIVYNNYVPKSTRKEFQLWYPHNDGGFRIGGHLHIPWHTGYICDTEFTSIGIGGGGGGGGGGGRGERREEQRGAQAHWAAPSALHPCVLLSPVGVCFNQKRSYGAVGGVKEAGNSEEVGDVQLRHDGPQVTKVSRNDGRLQTERQL